MGDQADLIRAEEREWDRPGSHPLPEPYGDRRNADQYYPITVNLRHQSRTVILRANEPKECQGPISLDTDSESFLCD